MENADFDFQIRKNVANKLNNHIPFFILIVIVCIFSIWGHIENFRRVVIRSDGTGYYEYLPAFIQYQDPWIERIRDRRIFEIEPTIKYNIIEFEKGKFVIKYPIGPALLWLPFYLGAHVFSYLHPEYLANSYSEPYQAAISIAATFYLLFSFFLLYMILRKKYAHVPMLLSFLGIIFGTNLFHYATFDACFSHVYSFFAVCLWLFILDQFFNHPKYIYAVLMGSTIGIVFLIRNINIIFSIIFIAYYLERFPKDKDFYLKTGIAVLFSILTVSLQFIYYYAAFGKLVLCSYGLLGESFTFWSNPRLLYILFSLEAGFFFWSPIVLLGLVEYLIQIIIGPKRGFAGFFLIIFVVYCYLIASWWAAELAGGFGHRGFIDLLPFLIIGLTSLFNRISNNYATLLSVSILTMCLIVYSFLLMLGYWNGVIPLAYSKWVHWKNALYLQ